MKAARRDHFDLGLDHQGAGEELIAIASGEAGVRTAVEKRAGGQAVVPAARHRAHAHQVRRGEWGVGLIGQRDDGGVDVVARKLVAAVAVVAVLDFSQGGTILCGHRAADLARRHRIVADGEVGEHDRILGGLEAGLRREDVQGGLLAVGAACFDGAHFTIADDWVGFVRGERMDVGREAGTLAVVIGGALSQVDGQGT